MNSLMTDEMFAASEEAQHWCSVMTRCTTADVLDLDPVLERFDPAAATERGKVLVPETTAVPPRHKAPGQRITVAVSIDAQPERGPALAARLAAFAIEKTCDVIVFTSEDVCGFEAYGFRTERIAGTETDILKEQLTRLWDIEIVF